MAAIAWLYAGPLFALKLAPPEPDPWFYLTIQIERRSLPEGVEYQRLRSPGGDSGYFTNATSTPLYFVRRPATPPSWVRDLPPNAVPQRIAVSGRLYEIGFGEDYVASRWEGIFVDTFVRSERFEMPAYLGSQSMVLRGRYSTGRLELDAPLPEGLRVAAMKGNPKRLLIANDSAVPLYVVTKFDSPVGWVSEVPKGFFARHKIVGGKAFQASTFKFRETGPDGWTEVPARSGGTLSERTLPKVAPDLKLRQVRADNRPAGVAVPQPQRFELVAFHGSKQVSIRGRVVYDLNPAYDPLASKGPAVCVSCTGSMCDECAKRERAGPAVQLPDRPAMF